MAKRRLPMRQLRQILKLKYHTGLTHREIAKACSIGAGTVSTYIARAREAGLTWPLPPELDDATLEKCLFKLAQVAGTARPLPEWATIHRELKRVGVTLHLLWLEYREIHPEGYAYSQFCDRYRRWRRKLSPSMRQRHRPGEKVFLDPDLPEAPTVIENVEQEALAQRVDLQLARHDLDALSKNLGLTRATRFVNVLEAGPARVREAGEGARTGYHVMFEIPIFDWGDARIAKAEHLYTQASERFRESAVNARSEMRLAYQGYRSSYDIARHYRDEIVPLRKQISDEQLLLYNGMLVDVFELIADAREQVVTVNGYLDALLDYWMSDTELQHALLNSVSPGMGSASAMVIPTAGESEGH